MSFSLRARQRDFYVEVRVRAFGGRWVAVAQIAGDQEPGIGLSSRDGTAQALESLGAGATAGPLADTH